MSATIIAFPRHKKGSLGYYKELIAKGRPHWTQADLSKTALLMVAYDHGVKEQLQQKA